jgi:4-hydroxyphenylacetate 3-monooxygenase
MKSEDVIAAKGRPFTGAEYLASLRDDRDVYVYGERVEDVTTHPAFRNAARSIARLYDALHDPKTKDVLTWPTDTGSGGYTHKFFRAARLREELIAQRDAIAQWARMSYGWMGRSPDYKAAFLATLGANADFYAPYQDNARRWYRAAQERVLYLNHALVQPPVDRHRPPDEVRDVYVHVEKETDAGLVVSGA